MSGVLGIIAGGGELPRAIAESARNAGRSVFVLALTGITDEWARGFPCEWFTLGEPGRAMKALRAHGCSDLTFAGRVQRPRFSELKLDAKGMLVAPRVISAALKGDDALLRSLVDLFEREGFRVIGAAEAAPSLLATAGPMGRIHPSERQMRDAVHAIKVARAVGALDVGQAAVVCDGLTLAVEAAEGTDAMIARIGALPEHFRGAPGKLRGVLAKALKPIQDRKTDLPVVGVQTLHNAASAYLAGVAIEAGAALVVDRAATVAEADRLGLFLIGVVD
jgi:DUF1009 family protein